MRSEYACGLRDGLAIGVGYFSVSFTFGILAVNGGLSPLTAGLISLTNMTSAGQFAGLTVILAHGSLVELALTQLVINLRYALMSLSLSQRFGPAFTTWRRMIVAFANTDEIFAVAMGRAAPLTPRYMYGLASLPIVGWTSGTVAGAVAGAVLSPAVRSALGVALYSMFIAIVVPPMRRSRPVRLVAAAAAAASCILAWTPLSRMVGSGFAIVLSTLAAAAMGAWLFPVDASPEDDGGKEAAV
ncbi:AzlC family ABC transporter permease [Candidatus Allofournierella merdavium]|uniref:AzlC family ABC transporter permease n=1 Tax=Candidatus Allofournierella merdavium TaxID=2838593 RepID=UPI00374F6215